MGGKACLDQTAPNISGYSGMATAVISNRPHSLPAMWAGTGAVRAAVKVGVATADAWAARRFGKTTF